MTWPSVAPLEVDVRLRGRGRIPESPMRGRVSCHGSTILLGQLTRKSAGNTGLPRFVRAKSSAAKRQKRQHLEAGVRREEGRHSRRVVRRRDLDTVEAPEVQACECAD